MKCKDIKLLLPNATVKDYEGDKWRQNTTNDDIFKKFLLKNKQIMKRPSKEPVNTTPG